MKTSEFLGDKEKTCLHECTCSCHTGGCLHCAPCCSGPCKICKRNIEHGMMKRHLKECHNIDLK